MTTYYIPYNFNGDYAVSTSYFEDPCDANQAACEWWCEEGLNYDDVDGYGSIWVEVEPIENNQYRCAGEDYYIERWKPTAKTGIGSTPDEAIQDYIDQIS